MARIRIEFDLDDEYLDESDYGYTTEADERITDFVNTMGHNLDVELLSK